MSNPTQPMADMSIAELHQTAMELYDLATATDRASGPDAAITAFRNALNYEVEAAHRLAPRIEFEPTRSVVLRSAATMALRCREYREAERLVNIALTGNPLPEVAKELRDLFKQINSEKHLEL